jgi:hypothetical protein
MLPPKSFSYLCASLLLIVSVSCTTKSQQAGTAATPVRKQEATAASARLKEAWTVQAGKLDKMSKDYPAERLKLLSTLLDKLPEEQVQIEMERLLANPNAASEMSEYEQTLLQAFTVRGIEQRNREMLTRLLSIKCPRFVGARAVEFYLALSDLPDPLLILFESYKKAANEDARATLYETLSHLCGIARATYSNDRGYITAVEEWYLKNKDRIEVNTRYHPISLSPEDQILFKER